MRWLTILLRKLFWRSQEVDLFGKRYLVCYHRFRNDVRLYDLPKKEKVRDAA